MIYNTDTLQEVLFGNQIQGRSYHRALCTELAKRLTTQPGATPEDLTDRDKCITSLGVYMTKAVKGEIKVPSSLLCLTIGLANFMIVQNTSPDDRKELRLMLTNADTGSAGKIGMTVTMTPEKIQKDLSRAETAERLVARWSKVEVPSYLETDEQKAIYGILVKAGKIKTRQVPLNEIKEIMDGYASITPEFTKREINNIDRCAVYSAALNLGIGMQWTEEVEYAIKCEESVFEFLQKYKYPIDLFRKALFGNQIQGDAFMTTLCALTAKFVGSNGFMPDDLWNTNDVASAIVKSVQRSFSSGRANQDPLLYVLVHGMYIEMTPEELKLKEVVVITNEETGKCTFSLRNKQ